MYVWGWAVYMLESIAAIITFNLIVYYRALKFLAVVDDIRWYASIQKGNFKGKWTAKNFINKLTQRIYGGGTFARLKTCPVCKGQGHVRIPVVGPKKPAPGDNGKKVPDAISSPCKQCQAQGEIHITNIKIDHLFSIIIHTFISVLIYLSLGRDAISFWAAMLYSCNPANTQTSIWLNGRRYAVNVALMLLTILTPPWGILLYLFSLKNQVTTILAPILLGGFYWLLIPAALWMGKDRYKGFYKDRMLTIVNDDMRKFTPKRLIVITKTLGFYTAKMLFPGRILMAYPFLKNWGLTEEGNEDAYRIDYRFGIGIGAMAMAIFAVLTLPDPLRLYAAFTFLATLQWCNILVATQTAADRYISAPNVFMMFFVSFLAHRFLGGYAVTVIVALMVYYLTNLSVGIRQYPNIESFFNYHLYFDPANVIARKFRINWLLNLPQPDVLGAWELIKAGLISNPNDFSMLYQAALCLQIMGDAKASNLYVEKCEENHYINQKPLWDKHLIDIRNRNKQTLDMEKPSQLKGRMMNFARGKK